MHVLLVLPAVLLNYCTFKYNYVHTTEPLHGKEAILQYCRHFAGEKESTPILLAYKSLYLTVFYLVMSKLKQTDCSLRHTGILGHY